MEWFDDLMQDLRLAARMLVRNPGFAGAAVVTLGCGISLAIAMFTVSDAVLRRRLPIEEQERVVVLWGGAEGSVRKLPLTYEHFQRFREEARTLNEVAGTLSARAWPYAVRDGERTLSLNMAAVTGNFFRVLGSAPVLGRTLQSSEDVVGAPPVMVISHGLWRTHFGAGSDVIGHRLTLHERRLTYTVVGVASPGLEYPAGADFWVPLAPFARLEVVPLGRLARSATPALAAGELRASFQREASRSRREVSAAAAAPLSELVLGDVRPALLLLSAAAALLLLIACMNVANLLLVRASARSCEIAVRRALGAGSARILRQLLAENSLLALAGGLLGTALAVAFVRSLLALAPPELPRLEEIRLTGVPFGIAVAVTLAAVLVFGLIPTLSSLGNVAYPLRAGDRSSTESKRTRRAQYALVVFQVGLVTVMLGAAGLLARSLRQLERLDVGFDVDPVAVVQLAWPQEKFNNPEKVSALWDQLIPRIEALPEIASVSPVNVEPFTGAIAGWDGWFVPEGKLEIERATAPVFNMAVVGAGYFQTLGVPILRGRSFTEADRKGSPRVAMVSEAVARLFWPGQDAVGKRIGLGRPAKPDDWWTVVGLVPETHYRVLREPAATVYLPFRQFAGVAGVNRLAVRTNGDPAAAVPSIRRAIQETDIDLLVMKAESMERLVARQLARPRLSAFLLGVFGIGAVLLAAIGLYAMLAYVVRRRTRELAIRHALGASPSHLRSLVLEQALALAGLGILLGLSASLAVGGLLRSLLFGVSPVDPLTLAGVVVVLLAVAVAASYVPALRAMRADPVAALREE